METASAACYRRSKKLTEYEKWEYKQLIMSGVLDVREHPLFDEEEGHGVLAGVDQVRVCAASLLHLLAGSFGCEEAGGQRYDMPALLQAARLSEVCFRRV